MDSFHVRALPRTGRVFRRRAVLGWLLCGATLSLTCLAQAVPQASAPQAAASEAAAPQQAPTAPTGASPLGTPLSPAALASLLPPAVYFRGKSAPIQLRNAAAVRFGEDAIVWAALVDTSGYATDVQERYQFYLVTEAPLLLGGMKLAAGAYGAGFLGDRFLIMDLGGHTVAEGILGTEPALKRPRPLQMLPDTSHSVKLFLGRHWVELQSAPFKGK